MSKFPPVLSLSRMGLSTSPNGPRIPCLRPPRVRRLRRRCQPECWSLMGKRGMWFLLWLGMPHRSDSSKGGHTTGSSITLCSYHFWFLLIWIFLLSFCLCDRFFLLFCALLAYDRACRVMTFIAGGTRSFMGPQGTQHLHLLMMLSLVHVHTF